MDPIASKGLSALGAIGSGRQGSDDGGYSFVNYEQQQAATDAEAEAESTSPLKPQVSRGPRPRPLLRARQYSPMHISIAGPTLIAMNLPHLLKLNK